MIARVERGNFEQIFNAKGRFLRHLGLERAKWALKIPAIVRPKCQEECPLNGRFFRGAIRLSSDSTNTSSLEVQQFDLIREKNSYGFLHRTTSSTTSGACSNPNPTDSTADIAKHWKGDLKSTFLSDDLLIHYFTILARRLYSRFLKSSFVGRELVTRYSRACAHAFPC